MAKHKLMKKFNLNVTGHADKGGDSRVAFPITARHCHVGHLFYGIKHFQWELLIAIRKTFVS